jgi:hypothetical protein
MPMAKTTKAKTTTPAPTMRRLHFLENVSGHGWVYISGQVADVSAAIAAELLQNHQAEETTASVRRPVWAVCPRCQSAWHHERVVADRPVRRWTDDVDQSPCWAQCRCGAGWFR